MIVVIAGLLASCGSSNGLTEDDRAAVAGMIVSAADGAGLVLPTAGVECFAEQVDDDVAATVLITPATDWDPEAGAAVAETLVTCVGAAELMSAELRALRPDLGEPSVACVAERLDAEVVEQVTDAALRQRPRSGPAVEVELGVALGVCLSPEELLDL